MNHAGRRPSRHSYTIINHRSIVLSIFSELFELSSCVFFETMNSCIELEYLHIRAGTLASLLYKAEELSVCLHFAVTLLTGSSSHGFTQDLACVIRSYRRPYRRLGIRIYIGMHACIHRRPGGHRRTPEKRPSR